MKATGRLLLQTSAASSKQQQALLIQRTAHHFSQQVAKLHEKRHSGLVMDPKFYENDFLAGKSDELEFVRSPFYDMARAETLNQEQAGALLDDITQKLNHIEGFEIFLQPPVPTKENVAYTRYADQSEDPKVRSLY